MGTASFDNSSKSGLLAGQPDFKQVQSLSRNLNISIQSIEELRRKYLIYKGRNDKINLNNYVIFYKEYVNLYAKDLEIIKSYNAFDLNRDGYLDFSELLTAVAWHTKVERPFKNKVESNTN